jgi:hypothetical protein
MSHETERADAAYIRAFIIYAGKRHPMEMGVDEIRDYVTPLAVDKNVAATTQNVAFIANFLLDRQVPGIELRLIDGVLRAKRPPWLPAVFAPEEVEAFISKLDDLVSLPYALTCKCRVADKEFARARLLPSANL